jgi:hypothetical protein
MSKLFVTFSQKFNTGLSEVISAHRTAGIFDAGMQISDFNTESVK